MKSICRGPHAADGIHTSAAPIFPSNRSNPMLDFVFVAAGAVLFLAAVLYTHACDRL
jgi:hypothetical protein